MATELEQMRTDALRVPCPYRLPESAIPRSARRRRRLDPDADSAIRCGAQPGQACREPRSGERLGKLPHRERTELATATATASATDDDDDEAWDPEGSGSASIDLD